MQDTWDGLLNGGQAALLPRLPALVDNTRQLVGRLAAAQAQLRGAAAELRRLAELNAVFARQLAGQPACAQLVRAQESHPCVSCLKIYPQRKGSGSPAVFSLGRVLVGVGLVRNCRPILS